MLNKALAVLGSSDQTLGKNRHSNVIINVGQSHNALWTPQITYSKSNIVSLPTTTSVLGPKKKKKHTHKLINIVLTTGKEKIHKAKIAVLFIK